MQKKRYFTLPPESNPRFGRDRQIMATAFLQACIITGLLNATRLQAATFNRCPFKTARIR